MRVYFFPDFAASIIQMGGIAGASMAAICGQKADANSDLFAFKFGGRTSLARFELNINGGCSGAARGGIIGVRRWLNTLGNVGISYANVYVICVYNVSDVFKGIGSRVDVL